MATSRSYERLGDPDEDSALTERDHRRQRQAVARIDYVQKTILNNAPPPLPASAVSTLRSILSHPSPPSEQVQWRLRLYCGHVVERTSHRSHKTVHDAFLADQACEACGLAPATIVAGKPLHH